VILLRLHAESMKKKNSKFAAHPPVALDINEANALIEGNRSPVGN